MLKPADGLNQTGKWRGQTSPLFFFQLLAFVLAIALAIGVGKPRPQTAVHRVPRVAVPAQYLPHMVLGFNTLMADVIWLRLIQEIDYKDPNQKEKGWVYQLLDGITTLDPRHRIAYSAGLTILSVLIDDTEGARLLYDRGVENFPGDWPILYKAGYHYLFMVKDCVKAAELFQRAADKGAPRWLMSFASRLYQKAGQYEIARLVIMDSIKRFEGTEIEERLKQRLRELDEKQVSTDPKKGALVECKKPSDTH